MVCDFTNEFFLFLIWSKNIGSEDIAVRAYEKNLATCSFFEDGPLSDHGVRFLSSEGEKMPAGIVKNSYFLIDSNKDTHFGKFDFIDVEVTNIISEACSRNISFIINAKKS